MKPKEREARLWEYRVDYARAGFATTSSHYYMCEDATSAINAHAIVAEHHDRVLPILAVFKNCPYRNEWIEETNTVTELIKQTNEREYNHTT